MSLLAKRALKHSAQWETKMFAKSAIIGGLTLLSASIALAQNAPPPGNVNPGSQQSGAEPSGATNQPRSQGEQPGTMGTAPKPGGTMEKESSPSSTAGGAQGTTKGGPDTPGTK